MDQLVDKEGFKPKGGEGAGQDDYPVRSGSEGSVWCIGFTIDEHRNLSRRGKGEVGTHLPKERLSEGFDLPGELLITFLINNLDMLGLYHPVLGKGADRNRSI